MWYYSNLPTLQAANTRWHISVQWIHVVFLSQPCFLIIFSNANDVGQAWLTHMRTNRTHRRHIQLSCCSTISITSVTTSSSHRSPSNESPVLNIRLGKAELLWLQMSLPLMSNTCTWSRKGNSSHFWVGRVEKERKSIGTDSVPLVHRTSALRR